MAVVTAAGIPVLVLCDDYWHPARVPRAGLAPLAGAGFAFDWIEHPGAWSAARMDAYSLVVLSKANTVSAADQRPWLTEEVQAAFREYVQRGRGLLVIHSGAAGVQELPVLRGLIGGAFNHHPAQCPVTVAPRAGDALSAGIAPFTVFDEHYFMDLDDPAAEVFLTTESEHGLQPGGWRRTVGAGRVCVLTPGHNLEVWRHPSYQRLIRNALLWCGTPATGEAAVEKGAVGAGLKPAPTGHCGFSTGYKAGGGAEDSIKEGRDE